MLGPVGDSVEPSACCGNVVVVVGNGSVFWPVVASVKPCVAAGNGSVFWPVGASVEPCVAAGIGSLFGLVGTSVEPSAC